VQHREVELPWRAESGGCVLEIAADGTFCYLDEAGLTGWRGLGFDADVGGQRCRPTVKAAEAGEGECELRLEYPATSLTEAVRFRVLSDPAALTVERVFANAGPEAVEVSEVRTSLAADAAAVALAGASAGALECIHVSNLRESSRRVGWRTGPLVSPLPHGPRTLGDSEGHPFPALAVGRGGDYLLEAALQQDLFTQMWAIRGRYDSPHPAGSIYADYAAIARDGRRQPLTIPPAGRQRLSWLFYQIKTGCEWQGLYDDYLAELGRQYDLHGHRSPLLNQALYCTWNYTFFADISEDILRAQCDLIARRLKGVRHFLIDDGYQRPENKPSYDMGRFYPDPAANVDPVKFPHGMKAVAEMIRSAGLKPAIWWSPAMGRDNDLVREHPEWLCLDDRGESWTMDASGPYAKAALDFSVPAAREFVEAVLETLFVEWGFEGIKLDFCTYPFDSKDIRLRGGEGVRWWNWLLATIRKLIGPDGVFQLCGGAPYGNPFLGRWCDNHRVGGDIGKGQWTRHRAVSQAPLPLLAVPGRATLLMDVDSAGVRADLTDDENLSRLNFCHITQGVMGIGGDLTKLSETQLGWLDRITARCDRGRRVRCPDRRAFLGEPLPEVLHVDYPPDGPTGRAGVRKEVALFNWDDQPRTIGWALAALGIEPGEAIVDFWTGRPVGPADGQLVVSLAPRASRLVQVRRRA